MSDGPPLASSVAIARRRCRRARPQACHPRPNPASWPPGRRRPGSPSTAR